MIKLNSRQGGFTIVETMIVLAIVGAIMLVVFLAVPALQRNSRNTQRRSDVSRIGGAVNEFITNHNGSLPDIASANETSPTSHKMVILASAGNLSQYGNTDISITNGAQGAIGTDDASARLLRIVKGARCSGSDGAAVNGTLRQMAIQYVVETGGGYTAVCQEI